MGKEASSFSPPPPPSVGVMQILKDASDFSTKSWKSMLATVLVAFTLCSLLFLGARFSTSPLMDLAMDLHLLHAKNPAIPHRLKLVAAAEEDARVATSKELVFLGISFLTSWVSSVAAFWVHDVASPGSEKLPTTSKRQRGEGGWVGPLVTLCCIAALMVVYALFLEALVLVLLTVADGSVAFVAVGILLASIARLLSFCQGMFWGQGMAISMLDDEGCDGMEALRRPLQLLRALPASHPELPV